MAGQGFTGERGLDQPGGIYTFTMYLVGWNECQLTATLSRVSPTTYTWTMKNDSLSGPRVDVPPETSNNIIGEFGVGKAPNNVEPPLTTSENLANVFINIALTPGVSSSTCTISAPLATGGNACAKPLSYRVMLMATARVEVPPQTSQSDWSPGQWIAVLTWSRILDLFVTNTTTEPMPTLVACP